MQLQNLSPRRSGLAMRGCRWWRWGKAFPENKTWSCFWRKTKTKKKDPVLFSGKHDSIWSDCPLNVWFLFQVDSSKESAEAACDILSQLVNCSLKTLGLISTARPSFMDLPKVLSRLLIWSGWLPANLKQMVDMLSWSGFLLQAHRVRRRAVLVHAGKKTKKSENVW